MSELVRPNIAQMSGYVPGEQPTDPGVIKLNTNENPYPPSPRVMEAIGAITPEQLRRYPSPNAKAFREAAARVHGVSADMILATNGGDELLSVAIRACAGQTETVAFLEPSYSLYPVLADMQGARHLVLRYQLDGANWRLPAGIENTQAAILLIVNPNAPSGTLTDLSELAHIAKHFRGVLVIDEAYVDFAPRSALELARQFPNVLILRSMSKGYGLAGLRFGYGIAQPALLRQLEKVRDSYACDAVAIAAATAAILDQDYARQRWEKVIAERTRLAVALRALGFELTDSHSNFLLATVAGDRKLTARQVYETLKGRNILVRWWDLPQIADKIRITVGTAQQNDALLHELSNIV